MIIREYSTAWKSSSRARKQRKFVHNAAAHLRTAFLSAHLSKALRQQYKRRAVPLKTGDKVKVMRGASAGKIGAVERVDSKKIAVYITGVDRPKRDGSKQLLPLHPSNLLIEELDVKDRKRLESIKGKEGKIAADKKTTSTSKSKQ
ncbi:MAG: 50S ribosomal protein L24 [Nanoarchaeota archaeon]